MQRTREPPLSSGATSAIIKPTNLRRGLPPPPRFIDPTSTRPPSERGQEAVSSAFLSSSIFLVHLVPPTPSYRPCAFLRSPIFFPVTLVGPRLMEKKKNSHYLFFAPKGIEGVSSLFGHDGNCPRLRERCSVP